MMLLLLLMRMSPPIFAELTRTMETFWVGGMVNGFGEMVINGSQPLNKRSIDTKPSFMTFSEPFFGKSLGSKRVAAIPSSSNEVKSHSQISNLKPKSHDKTKPRVSVFLSESFSY